MSLLKRAGRESEGRGILGGKELLHTTVPILHAVSAVADGQLRSGIHLLHNNRALTPALVAYNAWRGRLRSSTRTASRRLKMAPILGQTITTKAMAQYWFDLGGQTNHSRTYGKKLNLPSAGLRAGGCSYTLHEIYSVSRICKGVRGWGVRQVGRWAGCGTVLPSGNPTTNPRSKPGLFEFCVSQNPPSSPSSAYIPAHPGSGRVASAKPAMQSRAGKNENAAADWSAWASVPWSPVYRPGTGTETGVNTGTNSGATTGSSPIGWLKSGIPYLPADNNNNYNNNNNNNTTTTLQTLDVWIPANNTTTPPPASSPPPHNSPNNHYLIYIHGGAWRDPTITSASFTPTATNLLLRAQASSPTPTPTSAETGSRRDDDGGCGFAGLISLNYRLSPHPAHPPASAEDAVARGVRHPGHVADVRAGLAFLGRLGILSGDCIEGGEGEGGEVEGEKGGAGGEEGGGKGEGKQQPAALVGFNGLYDLAGFIAAPPEGYAHLRDGYREFVEGAFGANEGTWRDVCPATAEGKWLGEWIGDEATAKKTVVLVQSREDTLVPWEQLEAMRARLEREGRVDVKVMEATGNHDDVWREGGRLAEPPRDSSPVTIGRTSASADWPPHHRSASFARDDHYAVAKPLLVTCTTPFRVSIPPVGFRIFNTASESKTE
ncbi:hypothetical protein CHGG_10448 [Chaetomium globosum CBS 148.51]|uniref:Uncharacterized protein n=1 Tax=Chaetomium globosum (strain ATCC 6205 / CBS 148.51 / DSM 1962 / NBRC 6347 / NRRL 1970) TaxID=306901 RepID=Q2GNK6_CHAGB|nr:uncharacterized protein CHGG_10448 [Chaetomium globosum CBS 148.51]EAQ84044.1 hypothetical protein CHGG_10448 [Chaetomium globosum CBS 148.51]